VFPTASFVMWGSVAAILVFSIMPIVGSRDAARNNRYTQLSQLRNRSISSSDAGLVVVDSRRLSTNECEVVTLDPIWDRSRIGKAKGKCNQCVAIVGSSNGNQKCKWCPLTQICQPARDSAGKVRDCTTLPSQRREDAEVTTAEECEARPASWMSWMDSAYGTEWSENKESYMDVIRCSQWALNWPISEDMYMSGKKDISPEDIAHWGCNSAQIRAALMRLFSGQCSAIDESKTEKSDIQNWKAVTLTPTVCELTYLKNKDSVVCNVDLYGEKEFAILRQKAASGNHLGPGDVSNVLLDSVKSGPLVSFSPGAGKSGSGFVRAWDDKMKLKIGVKQSQYMDEPKNLLQLIEGTETAKPLHDHLKRNPNSLLNRYYGLVRTRMFSMESWTLVMQDASYEQDSRVQALKKTDAALQYTRYDLKGKSRSLTKKQEEDKQFTLINGDFKENEEDKLELTSRQCWRLRKAIRLDGQYLQEHKMIDYSLFIGVAHHRSKAAPDCSGTPGEPFCFQGNGYKYQYTISVIDYLNDLNGWKAAESNLKIGKFKNYSGKVMDYMNSICLSNESFEEMYDTMIVMLWVGGSIVGLMVVLPLFFFCRCKSAPEPVPWSQQELSSQFMQHSSSAGFQPAPSWGTAPSWGSAQGLGTRAQQVSQNTSAVSAPISSMGQSNSPMPSMGQPTVVISSSMGVQAHAQYQQTPWQPGSQFQSGPGY